MADEQTKVEENIPEAPTSPPEQEKEEQNQKKKGSSPVLWLTRFTLLLALILFTWYVLSDRNTPYTDQARITELVLPITPRVSGYLTDVEIYLHKEVKGGDLLFRVDTIPFLLNVKKAEANVDNAVQQMGVQGASVKAAASSVGVSKAQLDRAQRNYDRVHRIIDKNPGAISQADLDRVETTLQTATENLAAAEANLSKAKQQLGVVGPENPQLRLAISELERAQLELSFTEIFAQSDGFIESFNIDVGHYTQAGQPLATLVSKQDLWIQADFKENNISKMKTGNKALFILDIAPGRVFEGSVRSIGYGVNTGNTVSPGDLPSISSSSSWLRDPQRFPVSISIPDQEVLELCRAGGQADVVVFSGSNPFLIKLARLRIKINSWLSYVR